MTGERVQRGVTVLGSGVERTFAERKATMGEGAFTSEHEHEHMS